MPESRFKVRFADTDEPAANPSPDAGERWQQHDAPPRTGVARLTRRRGAWRQRLIDAECGLRLSLRMDGTLFVHLFVASCVLAAGFVLGLSAQQWAVVSLAITLVITTETFNQMLRALWTGAGHLLPDGLRDLVRIGAAADLLASLGAGAAIVLVFADRLRS
ncbi:MAG: diacylglycerol kinase family protein [Planctomycetaceae bacterium]|nr:diacylglycerol kinase family protein [Planctomycetaceae bacterium]